MSKHDAPYKEREPLKHLINEGRRNAKRKGMVFELTDKNIHLPRFCPVLGIELTFVGEAYNSPSIDRLDSAIGYTANNSVIVSWEANRLKSDATPHELWRLWMYYNNIHNERGIEK